MKERLPKRIQVGLVSAVVILAIFNAWKPGSSEQSSSSPIPIAEDLPSNPFSDSYLVWLGQTAQPLNKNPQHTIEFVNQPAETWQNLEHENPSFRISYPSQTYYPAISTKNTAGFVGTIAGFLKSNNIAGHSSNIIIAHENTFNFTPEDYVSNRLREIKKKDPGAEVLEKRKIANKEAVVLHQKPEQDFSPAEEFSVVFLADGNVWTISLFITSPNDSLPDYREEKLMEFSEILDSFTFVK